MGSSTWSIVWYKISSTRIISIFGTDQISQSKWKFWHDAKNDRNFKSRLFKKLQKWFAYPITTFVLVHITRAGVCTLHSAKCMTHAPCKRLCPDMNFLKRKNTVWPSPDAPSSLYRLSSIVLFATHFTKRLWVGKKWNNLNQAREYEWVACPLNQTVRFRMISYRIRIPKFHQIARKISKSFKIERLKLFLHWIDNKKHF